MPDVTHSPERRHEASHPVAVYASRSWNDELGQGGVVHPLGGQKLS